MCTCPRDGWDGMRALRYQRSCRAELRRHSRVVHAEDHALLTDRRRSRVTVDEYLVVHVFKYVCKYVCMYVVMYVSCSLSVHSYKRTFIHTYIHTYIHAYIHTYIHTYLHNHIHVLGCIHGNLLSTDSTGNSGM